MSRPGTTITRSTTRPSRSPRTATGPAFIVGPTGTADSGNGPRKPVTSLADYATRFGARSAHVNDGGGGAAAMYDFAEFYFKEGGSELFVSPAVYHATPSTYETNIETALALFTRDLGPGQVAVPGRTTAGTRRTIAVHAEANNRIGILATTNTGVVGTLTGSLPIASVTAAQERYISMFGPWVTVEGTTPGSTRDISPESIVMGLMARNDGRGVTPNQPSAGADYGESTTGLNVTQSYIEADRTTLNVNGINILRLMYDGVRVYGYRTLVDPSTDSSWINLANARLFMAIQAQADAVAERFVFKQLDGQRRMISQFGGALAGVVLPYWQNGSLYGATPEEAFAIDVGPNVNTDDTIANRELHANIALRTSEFAEEVILEIVKVRVTENV
jgi:hypothetical protein